MSDEGRLFLEACGASGPLCFEWPDPTTGEVRTRTIEKAALTVGRDPSADLVLDDPAVEPFHAFLQVVDGRLFAVDLGNLGGLRWGEVPREAGWVNRGQTLRIGGHAVRLVAGDRDGGESIVEPAPTSSRYASRLRLPSVALEFRLAGAGRSEGRQREVLSRVLVLCGRSDRCRIRLGGEQDAPFACSLLRTPSGLWLSNILPTDGARLNGAFCRFARVEDDDRLQIGRLNFRVVYDAVAETTIVQSPSGRTIANFGPARASGEMALPSDESSPESLILPLLEQAGGELGASSSPFGQALVLLVRLLGDVHRDQMALVRDELAQIRRLSVEMDRLRVGAGTREPGPESLPAGLPGYPDGDAPAADPDAELGPIPRPSPEAVHEIVGERIQAWERERQSRWRKVMRLLTQP